MSETLVKFGTSFQSKIIASLLSDKKFIQTIMDIINPSMFDSDSNKWLVKHIQEYYFEYKKQPTLEVLKCGVEEIDNDILKSGVVEKLRETWKLLMVLLPFESEGEWRRRYKYCSKKSGWQPEN